MRRERRRGADAAGAPTGGVPTAGSACGGSACGGAAAGCPGPGGGVVPGAAQGSKGGGYPSGLLGSGIDHLHGRGGARGVHQARDDSVAGRPAGGAGVAVDHLGVVGQARDQVARRGRSSRGPRPASSQRRARPGRCSRRRPAEVEHLTVVALGAGDAGGGGAVAGRPRSWLTQSPTRRSVRATCPLVPAGGGPGRSGGRRRVAAADDHAGDDGPDDHPDDTEHDGPRPPGHAPGGRCAGSGSAPPTRSRPRAAATEGPQHQAGDGEPVRAAQIRPRRAVGGWVSRWVGVRVPLGIGLGIRLGRCLGVGGQRGRHRRRHGLRLWLRRWPRPRIVRHAGTVAITATPHPGVGSPQS